MEGIKETTIKVDNSSSVYYCIDFNHVILGPQNENSGGIKASLEVELMSCLILSDLDIIKNNLTCSQILLPTVNFKFSIYMPVYKFDSSNINRKLEILNAKSSVIKSENRAIILGGRCFANC